MKMKTSKYWGVSLMTQHNGSTSKIRFRKGNPWRCWVATSKGIVTKLFPTEREAAIHADRINLEYGLGKPLNILKPKA